MANTRKAYVLYISSDGEGDYAVPHAKNYGLEKIFNRWYHHAKTTRDGQPWEVADSLRLKFDTSQDFWSALELFHFFKDCIDDDESKHNRCHLFTDDDVWTSCGLSDDDVNDDPDQKK